MLQLREAFILASTPALVGAPLLGRQLLALAAPGGAPPGPLADKLAFNTKVYDLLDHRAAERIDAIEKELQHHQLTVPGRPKSSDSFAPWRDSIIKSVLSAVAPGTPASLAVVLGLQVGEGAAG